MKIQDSDIIWLDWREKLFVILASEEMLKHSIRLLIHYLKFSDVPIPYSSNHLDTLIWTPFDLNRQRQAPNHTSIQQRLFLEYLITIVLHRIYDDSSFPLTPLTHRVKKYPKPMQ